MTSIDPVLVNEWFAVSNAADLTPGSEFTTVLLEQTVAITRLANGTLVGRSPTCALPVHCLDRYGHVWVAFGDCPRPLFELPEFDHAGRRYLYMGAIGIHANGLRVVENFLDMAHFPYVHTGILGAEPLTEVNEYKAELRPETGELWASGCEFVQPRSTAASTQAKRVDYTYRVANLFAPMLYKTSDNRDDEMDLIFLFVQPMTPTRSVLHFAIALFDDMSSDTAITSFQQTILGQDKPILENHHPQLIPVDPKFEVPARADAASALYRRWLRSSGLTFGMQTGR
ncbi:Phenylpropionate dioxygenase, large terminal subunit [Burkholderia sp. GAS332]|nr:Phenylpropionate dioxygenase, large terminal subunit [Burkholderia sp. GAS332]